MQTIMMLLGLWTGPVYYWKVDKTECFRCAPNSQTITEIQVVNQWWLSSKPQVKEFLSGGYLNGYAAILIFIKDHKIPYAFGSYYDGESILQKAQK